MPDLGQSASVPAVAAQSLPSQAQLSNNQILCAFAHRVLNQERARLLKKRPLNARNTRRNRLSLCSARMRSRWRCDFLTIC